MYYEKSKKIMINDDVNGIFFFARYEFIMQW